jgi:SAM-dependent methyltransferase
MGIDVYSFNFLLALGRRDLGDTLCLGRQGFHIAPETTEWRTAQDLLAQRDPGRTLEELISPEGYSESFFSYLGSRTVVSLDISTFENAEIIHDLNKPVPAALKDRFDFIFDGGTLEHVYNFPRAIANVKFMLRTGGLFVSANAANNQLGHGLYQFSPELFWRLFPPDAGFVIERMQLVGITEAAVPAPLDLVDSVGRRQEIGTTPHPTYIMVAARRQRADVGDVENIYQSDYVAAWSATDPPRDAPATVPAGGGSAERYTPGKNLTDLANKYGSDRGALAGSKHRYADLYELAFRHIRDQPIVLLEIGLAPKGPEIDGSVEQRLDSPSVSMWLEYFPSAEIVGFDIRDFSHLWHERFSFIRGDCGSRQALAQLADENERFDIIIDDASHASYHQQLSFIMLFPKLAHGGLYIIESLHWQSPYFQPQLPQTPTTGLLFSSYFDKLEYIPNPVLSEDELASIAREVESCTSFPDFDIEAATQGPKVMVIRKR